MIGKISIHCNGDQTTIMIDGRPVNNVTSFHLEQDVDDPYPTLHLRIIGEVTVTGHAELEG